MGLGLTGKLGRAWVDAWYVHGMAHGVWVGGLPKRCVVLPECWGPG